MVNLANDWLTKEPIDFEYKKYILLAYEKQKQKLCDRKFLYPSLSEILQHHKSITKFLSNCKKIEESSKKLKEIDFNKNQLIYESNIIDENLDELKEIAEFGKLIFEELMERFKIFYNIVEKGIKIQGYQYDILGGEDGYIELYHGLKPIYYNYKLIRLYNIESEYILSLEEIEDGYFYKNRYNRNFYRVITDKDLPFYATVMPVVKRKFLATLLKK